MIVPTLLAAAPFFYLAFSTPDILVWPLMVIGGGLMYASISPTTLMAQEMLPRSQGMAGGLVLGFANGIGGLLVFVTGIISDHFGLFAGILSLMGIIVAAGLLAMLLPGEPANPLRPRLPGTKDTKRPRRVAKAPLLATEGFKAPSLLLISRRKEYKSLYIDY